MVNLQIMNRWAGPLGGPSVRLIRSVVEVAVPVECCGLPKAARSRGKVTRRWFRSAKWSSCRLARRCRSCSFRQDSSCRQGIRFHDLHRRLGPMPPHFGREDALVRPLPAVQSPSGPRTQATAGSARKVSARLPKQASFLGTILPDVANAALIRIKTRESADHKPVTATLAFFTATYFAAALDAK